jgi:hypothetical protein
MAILISILLDKVGEKMVTTHENTYFFIFKNCCRT